MAKKVTGYIKLQIPAGKATPAPPVGPALGQHGVNIMAFTKEFNERTKGDMGILLRLLNPFAPHITEELWEHLGFAAQTHKMCCQAEWPVYDASKTVASSVEMAIQVNGKMKGTVTVAVDSDEETVKAAALSVDKVQKATEGMQIVKTILVKNRLINLIVKPQ